MLATTVAYWSYVSAHKSEEIALAAEKNAETLLEQVRKLVAADEMPASEIDFAVAAARTGRRAASPPSRRWWSARVLSRRLGLTVEQMSRLPPAADDYPELTSVNLDATRDTDRLVKLALDKRADLEANRTLQRPPATSSSPRATTSSPSSTFGRLQLRGPFQGSQFTSSRNPSTRIATGRRSTSR